MKRKIIALALCALALLASCGKDSAKENPEVGAKTERFVTEYKQVNGVKAIMIILDTETGERYLYIGSGSGDAVTHLESGEE